MLSKYVKTLIVLLFVIALAIPSSARTAPSDAVIEPFPTAPLCADNNGDGHSDATDNPMYGKASDYALWHDLWNEVDGCHYDHEHGDNPALADGVFGKLGEEWGGVGIDHPFHTPNELNDFKHRSHKVSVRVNIPCRSVNGSDLCITDVRILHHLDFFAMSTRFHSFWMEARVCRISNPSDCGIFGRGGRLDFGALMNQTVGDIENPNARVPVPADTTPFGLPTCGTTNRRLHRTDNQFAAWYGFFYGAADPNCIPSGFWAGGTSLGWLQVGSLVNQTWANLNLSNPENPVIICPDGSCTSNESLREQAHLIAGSLNSALAVNGKINAQGFTNVYGFIDPSCTTGGETCAPFYATNVPVGSFQYRDDAFGLDKKQYDILFGGRSPGWIRFPGQPSQFPTSTPPSSSPFVSLEVNPASLNIGGIALATVKLNNVPVEGYKSAEFTCTYDASLLETNNVVPSNLFGADAAVAIHDPQNGTFIVAIAGTSGNKATTGGPVFTFNVKALQAGQSQIQCAARVSKGDNIPMDLPSTGTSLTITEVGPSSTPSGPPTSTPGDGGHQPTATNTPPEVPTLTFTPTPSPNGSLAGQVIASKAVTVSLFDVNNVMVTSVVVGPDGGFNLTALAGNYTVLATADGFLGYQGPVNIIAGNTVGKPTISLLAGDIDGNNVIDQFDALTIGMSYNTVTPPAADLNNDGNINFLDLELLAENYRKKGPVVWE